MNFSEDLFLNFHAHLQMPAEDEIVIQSLFLQQDLITDKSDKIFFTAGLHPWHADQLSEQQIEKRLGLLIHSKSILAVGETGLDKLKGCDFNIQLEVFKVHIKIAEKYNLPLIVHSVKSHNEILKLKIDLKSKVPWVIHHFNGSKQIAEDFINHGFYLSVCPHMSNDKSRLREYMKDLAIDKLFLETDDFNIDIKDIYDFTAQVFSINKELLKKQLMNNLKILLNE